MLTKELLVARRRRGRIYPRFVDPSSPEALKAAQNVIELFEAHLGRRRGELQKALEKLETHQTFKRVRGLAQLLERQAVFETYAKVEPQVARRRAFALGYVTSPEERKARLQQVAQELSRELKIELVPRDVEEALRADREEHRVLRGFQPADAPGGELQPHLEWEPEALLRQYNLSLAQTLLFDALDVVFEVSGNYQPIFRGIKRLGLMYEALEEVPGRVQVRVDGPASLLKETTKYGTALAKLLPALVRAPRFQLQARIKDRDSSSSKALIFELDHTKRPLFPLGQEVEAPLGSADPGASFDSAVERDFYHRIRGVMRDWQVKREPQLLKAGPYVFIPDFGFAQPGSKPCYYLEIVGFWTPEYLKKKLAKLQEVEAPLLVAVDEALACSEADLQRALQGKEVFLYKKRLPLEPVVRRLLELAEVRTQRELETLKAKGEALWTELRRHLEAVGKVPLPLEELTRELGVGVEALRETLARGLKEGRLPGYRLIEGQLVPEAVLREVRREVEALPSASDGQGWELEPVLEVLERYGLGEAALEALGLKVERESLLNARVVARSG